MRTIAVVLTLVAVCGTSRTALGLSLAPRRALKASVKITADEPGASNATGTLILEQNGENQPVTIVGTIFGLSPGKHGFHVHERGDLSGGCATTGPHFNPRDKNHGAPEDEERHVGDLGNIEVNEAGVADVRITDSVVSLTGANSVIGRAIVVHSGIDDLGKKGHPLSSTTGNAGSRVACGVIGLVDASSPIGKETASSGCRANDGSSVLLGSIIIVLGSVGRSAKIRGAN